MTELPDETAAPSDASVADGGAAAVADAAAAVVAPRPGVPVWRVGRPDAFLAAEVDTARDAVLTIATDGDIGKHLGARSEGMRCVTHLFESNKSGYRGWVWFATLARVSRGKAATVNEVGLLPTEDSVLAPAWVPWSERVRPEDQQEADAASGLGAEPVAVEGGEPAPAEFGAEATPEIDASEGTAGMQDDSEGSFNGDSVDGDSAESNWTQH